MDLRARWSFGIFLFALATSQPGCGGPPAGAVASQESNLKPLAVVYGRYIGEHLGQPPETEADLKSYAQSKMLPFLKANNITDVESLFVSSRDKKPYAVLYGKLTCPASLNGQPVFAYEQEGVEGKRLVANSLGEVQEVDSAKFKELVPSG